MQLTERPHKDHKLLGTFLVVLSGFLYGMIGYFGIQLFSQGFSVPGMLFWRFAVAAVWMLLVGLVLRRQRRRKAADHQWSLER